MINLFVLTKELVWMVNYSCWGVHHHPLELFVLWLFEVWNHWFSFWVLVIQHIVMILIKLLNSYTLKSELFTDVLPEFSVLLLLNFYLFIELSFLSSLPFNPLLLLNIRHIHIRVLFSLRHWLASWFECSMTKLVFTGAFKCFVMDYIRLLVLNIYFDMHFLNFEFQAFVVVDAACLLYHNMIRLHSWRLLVWIVLEAFTHPRLAVSIAFCSLHDWKILTSAVFLWRSDVHWELHWLTGFDVGKHVLVLSLLLILDKRFVFDLLAVLPNQYSFVISLVAYLLLVLRLLRLRNLLLSVDHLCLVVGVLSTSSIRHQLLTSLHSGVVNISFLGLIRHKCYLMIITHIALSSKMILCPVHSALEVVAAVCLRCWIFSLGLRSQEDLLSWLSLIRLVHRVSATVVAHDTWLFAQIAIVVINVPILSEVSVQYPVLIINHLHSLQVGLKDAVVAVLSLKFSICT